MYPTIQDAVNDASCTPIAVAAGTYVENVTINRAVVLNGAQTGVDARTRSVSGESVIVGNAAVTINASNVVLDGFMITGPSGNSSCTGVVVKNSGTIIRNNIFDDIAGVTTTAQAISVYRGPDGVVILHNLMKNISSPNSAKGVLIEDSVSTDPSIAVTVEGNVIQNVTSTTKGAYGILVNNGNGATANAYLTFKDNDISALTGSWVHGIGLETDTPYAQVLGNTFSNFTAATADRVAVWFESVNASFSTAKVNANTFNFTAASGVYGIAVQFASGTPLDGTCNYWGSASGPSGAGSGTGALVSPLVTYAPLLQTPGGVCVAASQTITVTQAAPATAAYGTTFTVAATASSGLPVAIVASGACTINSGGLNSASLLMTSGTGTCKVTFKQAGNATYAPAPDVVQYTSAKRAAQSITVTQPPPATATCKTRFPVAATASSGLPVQIGVSGSCSIKYGIVKITKRHGTCTVTFKQDGNTNYSAAPKVVYTTTVH